MSGRKVSYVTLDVFTPVRYKGNQLAVVLVDEDAIAHDQMQMIAREFNFSETVFLHANKRNGSIRIKIFTPANEMDFAGHPVIGTGHVLFHKLLPGLVLQDHTPETASLQTNAGTVALHYDPVHNLVSAEIPHNVHIHSRGTHGNRLADTQPCLNMEESFQLQKTYPTISIVNGVTYILVDLTGQSHVFSAIRPGASPVAELDDSWSPSFTGTMYYQALGRSTKQGRNVQELRVRMIAINLEDPACGSGCCALGAYLALQDGVADGQYTFYVDQGHEIGRDSAIVVNISLNHRGDGISSIFLSGAAAVVTEGTLSLPE